MKILVKGIPTSLGDFLGILPAIVELTKENDVYIIPTKNLEDLAKLLPDIKIVAEHISVDKIIHVDLLAAFHKAHENNWYMTQAFFHMFGFPVPDLPPKANLLFTKTKTICYDYLLSPFGKATTSEEKWQKKKWQDLVNFMDDKKFALIGNSATDDMTFIMGNNIDVIFDLPFHGLCNLFANCGALLSINTGTSHLAFHLNIKNFMLNNQRDRWGTNPNAICIRENIPDLSAKRVVEILNELSTWPTITNKKFDENYYLINNPDVKQKIAPSGVFLTGYEHYLRFGYKENRKFCFKN
jgi:ADP-heptose:LPS heptosyltransferase